MFLILVINSIITIGISELYATDNAQTPTKPDSTSKFIAAPWASASTDEGIAVGFTAGISKFPNLLAYTSLQTSSKGYSSISLQAEIRNCYVKNILNASASKAIRQLYDPFKPIPEPYASAVVNRYQIRYSRLYQRSKNFAIGPDFKFDFSSARKIECLENTELPWDFEWPYPKRRFDRGTSYSAGLRARYATMNPNRPLNGRIVDLSFRIGQAEDRDWKLDLDRSGEILIALARQFSHRNRFYLRFLGQFQELIPPPIQNHLGGESTLRGEPSQRDYGNTILCGRAQYHLTVLKNWDFPLNLAHRIWSIFPVWAMDVEVVSFYDIGGVVDGHWGERSDRYVKTKQGYGGGLRFVIPPELVLYFDVAKSPHGSPRFYLGVGETL